MPYRVFISYKHTAIGGGSVTRDYYIASDLHRTLVQSGVATFFSEKDLSTGDYINEIYDALDEAEIMIVVGTKPEHVKSKWTREEWSTFGAAINGGRKPDGDIYTYLEGMTVNELPMMLYKRQSYTTGQKDKLVQRIKMQLGIKDTQKAAVIPSDASSPRLHLHIGETLPFGHFRQGKNGETMPLTWRVLDIQKDMALLISEKLIACAPYNEYNKDVTWETSSLRKWLNFDFLSKAFNAAERSRIFPYLIISDNGDTTQDKIFLLSNDEVKKYFTDNNDRMAAVSPYINDKAGILDDAVAKKAGYKNALDTGEKTAWWWLRSAGTQNKTAAVVFVNGWHNKSGFNINHSKGAVRPALWLNLQQ